MHISRIIFLLTAIFMLTGIANAQLSFFLHPAPGSIPATTKMNALKVDSSGNKFVAFAEYGLGIYDNSSWIIYDTATSSIASDSVIAFDFDIAGKAWIGTKAGASYFDGTTFNNYNTLNSGLPSDIVTAVLCDGPITWFGTRTGLVRYDGTTWNIFNSSNSGLENDTVTIIKKGFGNDLWIGTRDGVYKFDGSSWQSFTSVNSPLSPYIYDLEIDNIGRVWVSCGTFTQIQTIMNTAIFVITGAATTSFNDDPYFVNMEPLYMNGTDLGKDNAGRIYIFCNMTYPGSRGIFRIDGEVIQHYQIQGITFLQSYGHLLTCDSAGIAWFLSRRGFNFFSIDFSNYTNVLNEPTFDNFKTIDINDVKAAVNVSGDMHWDFQNPRYEVPKGSGLHSVFSSALWIGGIDAGGELHMAAQTYRQSGNDYWPGPIDGISIPFDTNSSLYFDQIWKIDKWKIEEFKNEYSAGNVTNGSYPVPAEIATWPAKGNGIVTGDKAPYVDVNADGIYNPLNGDYPQIKGDQMLFYIFNDSLSTHTETDSEKLGVEVHSCVYAYSCPGIADSNDVLNKTTLYNYKIINKSPHSYDDFYIGLWCDFDLGNASDDYVGCDTILNAGFAYNGDNDDENINGYGLNPPMQNVQVLRGAIAVAGDGIDNDRDGVIDEPGERSTMNHFMYYNGTNNSPTGTPHGGVDLYGYLRSIWLDGMQLTYGGDGRDINSYETNFMFPATPYDLNGWNEFTSGNAPEDRRAVLSVGPVSLQSGDTATIDFAYVFTRDSTAPNGLTTSVARNIADLQRVQNWFDNDNFPSCQVFSTGVEENADQKLTIYPNPASDLIFVDGMQGSGQPVHYKIMDLSGRIVRQGYLASKNIQLTNLQPQLYLIEIIDGDRIFNLKFVKSK